MPCRCRFCPFLLLLSTCQIIPPRSSVLSPCSSNGRRTWFLNCKFATKIPPISTPQFAAITPRHTSVMFNETAAAELGLTCPVAGNSDLYGLGIRIGIYIQMLTVQLSGLLTAYFQVEDHIGQGTIVFVLSTSIVLVRLLNATIQGIEHQTPIEPVEVFPVLTLLLIQVGVCRVSPRNKTTMLIWMVELVGLTALFAWFWWHGMDLLPRSCPDDKAFFFAQVSIWNWFRSLNKAGSVFAALGAAVAVSVYCGCECPYSLGPSMHA